MITLVVAAAGNGVIGHKGAIPWRIPQDLQRFKALTMGHPILMGRRTWDSFPKKPLPGRTNIVITRQPDWQAEGAVTAGSFEAALALAGSREAFVIGGGEIYRAALPRADRIELTEVQGEFPGDAFFTFNRAGWIEVAREAHPGDPAFAYVTLIRK